MRTKWQRLPRCILLWIRPILIAVVAFSSVSHVRAAEPPLSETLAWIDNTYNNHEKKGGAGGHGHVEMYSYEGTLFRRITNTFYYDNCQVTLETQSYLYLQYKSTAAFNLRDIDPSSLQIDMLKRVVKVDDPEFPSPAQNCLVEKENSCVFAMITFLTRDQMPLVTYDTNKKNYEVNFYVNDVDYAKRLAKALRHAIELCGGAPSPF